MTGAGRNLLQQKTQVSQERTQELSPNAKHGISECALFLTARRFKMELQSAGENDDPDWAWIAGDEEFHYGHCTREGSCFAS